MSLGASDLHISSVVDEATPSSLSAAPVLAPFDYTSARMELNEARECKIRADALLRQFAARSGTGGSLASLPASGTTLALAVDDTAASTAERLKREVDRRIAFVSRTMDARNGRPYPSKSASSYASSAASSRPKVASSRTKSRSDVGSRSAAGRRRYNQLNTVRNMALGAGGVDRLSSQRSVTEVSDAPQLGSESMSVSSPVTKMLRTHRRTSIRPAELSGIRTVPKAEVQVVKTTKRVRKAKQATPVFVDRRKPRQNKVPRPTIKRKVGMGPGSMSRQLVMLPANTEHVTKTEDDIGEPVEREFVDDELPTKKNHVVSSYYSENLVPPPPMNSAIDPEPAAALKIEEKVDSNTPKSHSVPMAPVSHDESKIQPISFPPTSGALPSDVSLILKAAISDQFKETMSRLIAAEKRERDIAEALRLEKARADAEAAARKQREEELMSAREHSKHMIMAIEAIKEANISLEVTNSALTEQVDKVHDRARAAEMDSLRQFQARLNSEEIKYGLHKARARDLAEDLPFERLCLDLVTELVMKNLQQSEEDEHATGIPAGKSYGEGFSVERNVNEQSKIKDNSDEDIYSEEEFEDGEDGENRNDGNFDSSAIDDAPAEEVGEEGLADAVPAHRQPHARQMAIIEDQQQPISQFLSSQSPSPSRMSRDLMSKLFEEKSLREKAELEIAHIREKASMSQKLYEAEHQLAVERDNSVAAQRYQEALMMAKMKDQQLQAEINYRKQVEEQLEVFKAEQEEKLHAKSLLQQRAQVPPQLQPPPPQQQQQQEHGDNTVQASESESQPETSLGALLRKIPPALSAAHGPTHGSGGIVEKDSTSLSTDLTNGDTKSKTDSVLEGPVMDIEISATHAKPDQKVNAAVGTDPDTSKHPTAILLDVRGNKNKDPAGSFNYNSLLSDYSSGSVSNISGFSSRDLSTSGASRGDLSSGSGSLFDDSFGQAGSNFGAGHLQDVSEVVSGEDSLFEEEDTEDMSALGNLDISRSVAADAPKVARSASILLGDLGVQDELLGIIVNDLP